MEAARPEECRTFNNRYLLVLANHNILILNKREQKIEGLEVDPNPSSFLLLYFVSHNSTNCIPIVYFTINILANYHPLLTSIFILTYQMQGRFKMEYRLFTIVRYNYKDYNC